MSGRTRIHRQLFSLQKLHLRIQQRGRKKRRIRPEIPLPMDLVMEEILSRLPAKSLMRFKCVSKLWSSHINSRYFSKRFLTRPHPRIYMCLMDLSDSHKDVTLSLAPDTTTATLSSSFVVDLTIPRRGDYMVQNLRGFMCYTSWEKPRIYNPATRQLVTLPAAIKSSNIIPPGESKKIVSYYYGHDPVNDRYKVVCSTGVYLKHLQEMRSEHWVFVLKSRRGSWKKLAPTPPDYRPHIPVKGGVCIDGVIYYMGWHAVENSALVSFHIRSQEFKMIQIPRRDGDDLDDRLFNVCLIEYGGKVAIIDQTNMRDKGLLDLWAVEDAGNKKWSRKTLVLQPSQLRLVNTKFKFCVTGTTQNGKVFLIPRDWFIPFYILCYDLQSNDLRKIEIKGIPEYWSGKKRSNLDFMLIDGSESLYKVIDVDGVRVASHLLGDWT